MTNSDIFHVKIGLLGPFYLVVDQIELEESAWKSKKALTMLKYLATRQGQKVSADVLIELLWPDNGDMDSMSNLHTAVWFARRMLTYKSNPQAESPLRYAHGSYWLDLDSVYLDLDQFERHVKASRQLVTKDPGKALLHCESALHLYRDDFLCEELYEEWMIRYREDYQELYFEVVIRSSELLIERGDLQGAIQMCRTAVKRDPFREELYQMGIRAYILGERHVDAINLYNRYSKMLMEEFQLEPSHSTQALIRQLKDKGSGGELAVSSEQSIEPTIGASVCDAVAMQFVLNSEQRRLTRNGQHFSILLAHDNRATKRSQQIQTAFHVLRRSLRNSDLICQFSENLIVVFLPDTNSRESQIIWRRLRQLLREKIATISTLSYTLLNSENLEDMQKSLKLILEQ